MSGSLDDPRGSEEAASLNVEARALTKNHPRDVPANEATLGWNHFEPHPFNSGTICLCLARGIHSGPQTVVPLALIKPPVPLGGGG
jgi:hypothetical protein